VLRSPEVVVRTWRIARKSLGGLSEVDVREVLGAARSGCGTSCSRPSRRASCSCWSSGVDVGLDGADIRLRTEGLTNLVADLRAVRPETQRAA
jgi:hypothetical protein